MSLSVTPDRDDAARTVGAKPGHHRGRPRRPTARLLRLDWRDRRRQVAAARRPRPAPRRTRLVRPHPQRRAYLDAAERVRDLRRQFGQLSAERQRRQRELSLLRFEREELDRAALEPGELADLTRERERLANAQDLQTFAGESYSVLYD